MCYILIPVIGGSINVSLGATILLCVGCVALAVYGGIAIYRAVKKRKEARTGKKEDESSKDPS